MNDLCYSSDNGPFIWWGKADLGLCLQNVALVSATSLMFAMASGFYCTWMRTSLRRRRPSIVLIIRMIISLALALNSLTELIITLFQDSEQRLNSTILSASLLTLSWLTHTLCVFVLTSSIAYWGHGPYLLNILWFLTGISSCFQFRTYLRWHGHPGYYKPYEQVYFHTWYEACVYINFSLQCLYGLTLLVPVQKVNSYDDVKLPHISQQEGQEMRRNLLTSDSFSLVTEEFGSYGAIALNNNPTTTSTLREAQEDGANILSQLFFYWVNPLMVKGSVGRLQKPEDLPLLPKSLNTEKIRNRFHNILFGTVRDSSPSNPSVKMMASASQEGSYHVYSEKSNIQDSTSSHKQQDDDDRYSLYSNISVLQSSGTGQPTTLFRALNKAFGLHYYPLGILKLLNDLLGFAGPLLLHALVSYMENNNVSYFCPSKIIFTCLILGADLSWVLLCYRLILKYIPRSNDEFTFYIPGTVCTSHDAM